MSDGARKFQLLTLSITSSLEEQHYTEALLGQQTMWAKVVGKRINVRVVMGGADKAQFNGIKNIFGALGRYRIIVVLGVTSIAKDANREHRHMNANHSFTEAFTANYCI